MYRWLLFPVIACSLAAAPATQNNLSGLYLEARTCEIWTGTCYGNAEMNLVGKNAVMAWKVEKGAFDQVQLDGLSVVAVIAANNTLGLEQTAPAKAVLIVDARATELQRQALIKLAKKQGGQYTRHVVSVESAPINLTMEPGKNEVVARLVAGNVASILTRALDPQRDRACGAETEFYPPLAKNVKARAAVAVEHSYQGNGLRATWKDPERRSAYVGRFEAR